MTLEEFAKEAGVNIIRCDKSWGGTYGYTTERYPTCRISGFRTEKAAYNGWLNSTFSPKIAKAIRKLLTSTAQ